MKASAALDTLREQLHKAQQEYLHMLQQSFQLELDISNCLETECAAKEEEQCKLDDAAEHTRKAIEQLQHHIDSFVAFLASTSATLGSSSTYNTTTAASYTTTPSPPTQKKTPRLSPGLPKFDVSKRQDSALHTMELEYHLNAYNYPEDRWMQTLITTLVGDRCLGPLALYKTQYGMSPETSSIGTTTFQTSRPQ
ncbi:hypothetical protein QOT17_012560 [Balamuthia mandrillaris]